ncbi:ester cyclase [Massilia sp. TS11]|uniref:ester cyclase n=1 Tax=Massilia sp. TS11 TaxID=2908003 RepID=UPI001EDB68E9|nr:ester cyclase [Massilia sp. TS11]
MAIAAGADAQKAVVARFNHAVIQNGERAVFDELMAPDFINWSAPDPAMRGAEGMWHTFTNVLRPAISGLTVEILDQLSAGDQVVTRKRITGRHTGPLLGVEATGKDIAIDVIDIVRIRDGRYAEHWGINSLAAVLAQFRATP